MYSKAILLVLASALTVSVTAAPAGSPTVAARAAIETTRTTVEINLMRSAEGCVEADGSRSGPTGPLVNHCKAKFTWVGNNEVGYKGTTSRGPCGFVNSVLTCGKGVTQATFYPPPGGYKFRPDSNIEVLFPTGLTVSATNSSQIVTGQGNPLEYSFSTF